MDPALISDSQVTSAVTKEKTSFKELWKDQTCVIIFLRRFGWPYCRLAAKEISSILPQLKEHNVRLIGVGLEPLGLEEFLEGNFFDGELFVDEKKESFKKLGFKRMSFLQLFPAVFSKKSREAKAKADSMKLGGNLSGDGYQNGGCLVVGAGGTPTMYTFKQEDAAEHPENANILEALGIQTAA